MNSETIIEAAETATLPPVIYTIRDAALAELSAKYSGLKIENNDKGQYLTVRAARLDCKAKRGEVEHTRKLLKSDALEYGRKVDAEAARITAKIQAVEAPLVDAENDYDAWSDAIKLAADQAKAARVDSMADKLSAVGAIPMPSVLAAISDADFVAMLEQSTLAFQAKQAAELKAQAERIAAENQAKVDALAALAAAASKRAAEIEAARVETVKADAERKRVAEAAAAENARVATENMARADALAKQAAELNAERDALAAIKTKAQAEADAHARALAIAPEIERLQSYAAALRSVPIPAVKRLADRMEQAQVLLHSALAILDQGGAA